MKKETQIKTLEQLDCAAQKRRSVYKKTFPLGMFNRPMPAAVLLRMTGEVILRAFRDGLYVYERAKRDNPFACVKEKKGE